MIKVLEGLSKKNASEKVTYGGEIKSGMTGNTYFADGTDLVTALNTATADLKTANETGDPDTVKPMG